MGVCHYTTDDTEYCSNCLRFFKHINQWSQYKTHTKKKFQTITKSPSVCTTFFTHCRWNPLFRLRCTFRYSGKVMIVIYCTTLHKSSELSSMPGVFWPIANFELATVNNGFMRGTQLKMFIQWFSFENVVQKYVLIIIS